MSTILFRANETLETAHESTSGKSPRTLAKPVQKPSRNHLRSSLTVYEVEGPPEKPTGKHCRCTPIPLVRSRQGLKTGRRNSPEDGPEIFIGAITRIRVVHQGRRHLFRKRKVGRKPRTGRRKISSPSDPNFPVVQNYLFELAFRECTDPGNVGVVDAIFTHRVVYSGDARHDGSDDLYQRIGVRSECCRKGEDGVGCGSPQA